MATTHVDDTGIGWQGQFVKNPSLTLTRVTSEYHIHAVAWMLVIDHEVTLPHNTGHNMIQADGTTRGIGSPHQLHIKVVDEQPHQLGSTQVFTSSYPNLYHQHLLLG